MTKDMKILATKDPVLHRVISGIDERVKALEAVGSQNIIAAKGLLTRRDIDLMNQKYDAE